jgi:hypothetical protein
MLSLMCLLVVLLQFWGGRGRRGVCLAKLAVCWPRRFGLLAVLQGQEEGQHGSAPGGTRLQ